MVQLGPGLRWAVETCRSSTAGPALNFTRGEAAATHGLDEFVPADALADLRAQGHITEENGTARLGVQCANFNNLVSVMPVEQDVGTDYVHLNSDTFWLIHLVWKHAKAGDCAVELGAGNAIIAAFLVARYRRVLATDLPGPWLRYAQLTLAANAGRGRPSAAIACDVASALRPESFDLVAANAPWSPAVPLSADGKELTFMAGGDTGTELPSRFLRDGARLLRPGGVAITLCLDPEFEDGSRPLSPVLDELRGDGYQVECIPSEVFPDEVVTERLRANRLPTLRRARHLAVIVRA